VEGALETKAELDREDEEEGDRHDRHHDEGVPALSEGPQTNEDPKDEKHPDRCLHGSLIEATAAQSRPSP